MRFFTIVTVMPDTRTAGSYCTIVGITTVPRLATAIMLAVSDERCLLIAAPLSSRHEDAGSKNQDEKTK